MSTFEQAFDDTERAAEAARKSATNVAAQARALVKAARSGNIAGVRRSQEKLEEAMTSLGDEVSNANSRWPFTEEEERRYFDERYAVELLDAADRAGLTMYERDRRLICYPSIVRILSKERAARVDRKKVSTIRPSFLVDLLLRNQSKTSSFTPQRFLDALYAVYRDIVGGASADFRLGPGGRVVPLARIYGLMTSLPGASRDYDRGDFARDLYTLDSQGPHRAKDGAEISFPASTGTRRKADLFSFVNPDGGNVEYYGVRFGETP